MILYVLMINVIVKNLMSDNQELTSEQKQELNNILEVIQAEADIVKLDYEQNPSNLDSGSVIVVHQDSSLLKDKKELAEHLMLLDLGRNDVGKVSKINSVKVTEKFNIEKYSHVMHIVSNVVGDFNNKYSRFKSLLAGFPAGTVSGAPKIRAMEIIDELESSKRKVYAGGIGYFSANGEFDTCIALRTALAKNNKFYVQAGAGIVADSKPLKEYEETVNKAKALLSSLK